MDTTVENLLVVVGRAYSINEQVLPPGTTALRWTVP